LLLPVSFELSLLLEFAYLIVFDFGCNLRKVRGEDVVDLVEVF
jgi:hypothetical protein